MRQLNMTELSHHFGVTINAELLADTLGVAADGKAKRATLYNESRLPEIGKALAKHIVARSTQAPGEKAPPKTPTKKAAAEDNSDLF